MNKDAPRPLFIEELVHVFGGNNAPIEPPDDMSNISKPGIDNEGPSPGLDLSGGTTEL